MEMNTRLQVEHTITEEVYNIDIVKEQINISSGNKLTYNQNDIKKMDILLNVELMQKTLLHIFHLQDLLKHIIHQVDLE